MIRAYPPGSCDPSFFSCESAEKAREVRRSWQAVAKVQTQKLTPKARKEAVEASIREKGWDHEVALDLAAATGWSWRTIYRDRDEVLDLLAQEEQEDLPRRRAAFLADLRHLRKEARADKAYAPAAKLLAMESQVLGLDRVPLPLVEEDDGPVDTSLEAILAETRRMRKASQAGASYVAAADLLDREHQLVNDIRARDQAKAEAEMAHLDEGEMVAALVANLGSLPDVLKEKLRAALGDP